MFFFIVRPIKLGIKKTTFCLGGWFRGVGKEGSFPGEKLGAPPPFGHNYREESGPVTMSGFDFGKDFVILFDSCMGPTK